MSFLLHFHSAISNHLSIAISMSPKWMVAVNRFNCTVTTVLLFSRTNKAMGEGLSFRVALSKRLDIIRPSHEKVKEFVKQHPVKYSTGIRYWCLTAE